MRSMRLSLFVLLHKKEHGLERCHVQVRDVGESSVACYHSVAAPGKGAISTEYLDPEYHSCLRAGETYVFFWPGAEIKSWEHNTMLSHFKKSDCRTDMDHVAPIILPASNSVEFTVFEEPEPWPERETWERSRGFWAANLKERNWRRTRNIRHRTRIPKVLTQADRE